MASKRTALNLAASTGPLTRGSLGTALASIKKITLDGHDFDTSDRRITYRMMRGQSVNGKIVFSPLPALPGGENQDDHAAPIGSGVQLTEHPAK